MQICFAKIHYGDASVFVYVHLHYSLLANFLAEIIEARGGKCGGDNVSQMMNICSVAYMKTSITRIVGVTSML